MKLKYPVIAAFVAMLSLTGCGGGGGGSSSGSTTAPADNPSSFSQTETTVGTGAEATSTSIVGVRYTYWLYSASAADHKGTQVDSNLTAATPLVYLLSAGSGLKGVDQGVTGMKVGGERVLIIPASMAFGANGTTNVPANAGLVFDVKLTDVQALADAPALSTTDTVAGTGATAAAGKTVNVKYSAYLYSATATDHKGILVDTNTSSSTDYSFVVGSSSSISGFSQGVVGMQVGGKRTVIVPSSLAYGTTGSRSVPGNSGMVFDIQLDAVQ